MTPKPCPTGQVCVDRLDPRRIADAPGVCVARVDCGADFGETCPDNWKCSTTVEDVAGVCVFDFDSPAATDSMRPGAGAGVGRVRRRVMGRIVA